jgi:DNA (cytosine-5)-methyltransferase 1
VNELALFAGAGGGILGGRLLGWRTRCAVEINAYARSVLLARQRDGMLDQFPIWDDVCTFDGRPWAGSIDVVSGGFPCQDISAAGAGAGIEGEKSGLWTEMARIIGEVRPAHVFVENSPMLTSRGLGRVLGDLASLGFDARWGVVSAEDCGAWHERERIWIHAHAQSERRSEGRAADADRQRELQPQGSVTAERRRVADGAAKTADAGQQRPQAQRLAGRPSEEVAVAGANAFSPEPGAWWASEPDVVRMVHGLASRVDRIEALGNGQVPIVAAVAWRLLTTDTPTRPRRTAHEG